MLYYADCLILAENEENLEVLNQLQAVFKESYKMKINQTKTKIIVTSKDMPIQNKNRRSANRKSRRVLLFREYHNSRWKI